jgi:hypothetical protein
MPLRQMEQSWDDELESLAAMLRRRLWVDMLCEDAMLILSPVLVGPSCARW